MEGKTLNVNIITNLDEFCVFVLFMPASCSPSLHYSTAKQIFPPPSPPQLQRNCFLILTCQSVTEEIISGQWFLCKAKGWSVR